MKRWLQELWLCGVEAWQLLLNQKLFFFKNGNNFFIIVARLFTNLTNTLIKMAKTWEKAEQKIDIKMKETKFGLAFL